LNTQYVVLFQTVMICELCAGDETQTWEQETSGVYKDGQRFPLPSSSSAP